ncbi:hypothetical protein TTHERM_002653311, partial (macronuclear) [Tetrahymena thermophila SB210]
VIIVCKIQINQKICSVSNALQVLKIVIQISYSYKMGIGVRTKIQTKFTNVLTHKFVSLKTLQISLDAQQDMQELFVNLVILMELFGDQNTEEVM